MRVVDPRKDALAAKNSCRDHGAPMSSAPLEEAYDEEVVRQAFEEAWMVYDEETGALEDGLAQHQQHLMSSDFLPHNISSKVDFSTTELALYSTAARMQQELESAQLQLRAAANAVRELEEAKKDAAMELEEAKKDATMELEEVRKDFAAAVASSEAIAEEFEEAQQAWALELERVRQDTARVKDKAWRQRAALEEQLAAAKDHAEQKARTAEQVRAEAKAKEAQRVAVLQDELARLRELCTEQQRRNTEQAHAEAAAKDAAEAQRAELARLRELYAEQERHGAELARRNAEQARAEATAKEAAQARQDELARLRGEPSALQVLSLEELDELEKQVLQSLAAVQNRGLVAKAAENQRRHHRIRLRLLLRMHLDTQRLDAQRLDMQRVEEERSRTRECAVCLEARSEAVFVPCGHVVCCPGCAWSVRTCPLCQTDIEKRVRVFL